MIRTRLLMLVITVVLGAVPLYSFAGQAAHSGVVLESVTGGRYTYINVEENGQKFWIAGPQTSVGKGARISFSEQIWMQNFKSKALNRTFDRILFVNSVRVDSTAGGSNGAAAVKGSVSGPAKAYTVEDLYSRKDELKGQLVKVRGNVVKVSANIMGRNWVHIQDGTGAEGSNKIIFRSVNGSADVGSVVTAQGRLEVDVDFGFGYHYAVIVEDSTFQP